MHEYSLFLRVLASRVYDATVGGVPVRDVGDFNAWLLELSVKAESVTTLEEFFRSE